MKLTVEKLRTTSKVRLLRVMTPEEIDANLREYVFAAYGRGAKIISADVTLQDAEIEVEYEKLHFAYSEESQEAQ